MRSGWWRAFRLGGPERDVAEEFGFHRARTVEDLMAEGWSRAEAEAEAERRFGDEARWRRELEAVDRGMARRRRGAELAAVSWDIVGGAVRGLVRRPALTAAVALTFALGVGANAVMFGMVDRLLLSPPEHVVDPSTVHRILVDRHQAGGGQRAVSPVVSYADFERLSRAESIEELAVYAPTNIISGHGVDAVELDARLATGNFFSLLGVRPALGRFFGPADDTRGGERVVVLSWRTWRSAYGGDPDIVGRALDVAGNPYTIIGVAPQGFTGVDLEGGDIWLPLHVAFAPGFDGWMTNPHWIWLRPVARTAPETLLPQVESEATTLYLNSRRELTGGAADEGSRVVAASLIAARGPDPSTESRVVRWLAGVSLIVLLIAAFNVANLLLARTTERRRELAVRLALGVSHWRLAARMLTESALLALLGAGMALALAVGLGGPLRRALLPDVAWGSVLTPELAAFTVVLAVVTGLAAMALPLRQALGGRVGDALGAGRTAGPARSRLGSVLTVGQAAFSVVLLVGAGLFIRSLDRVHGLERGVDTESLVVVNPRWAPELPAPELRRLMDEVERRLEGIPGVQEASLTAGSQLYGSQARIRIRVPGRDSIPALTGRAPAFISVRPDHLETLGLRLEAGRWIREDDVTSAAHVVVVDRLMADLAFDGDAVGRCFHMDQGPCMEIVGIASTTHGASPTATPSPLYYTVLSDGVHPGWPPSTAYVRVDPDVEGLMPAIRRAVLDASPAIRFVRVERAADRLAPHVRPWRLGAMLFSAFGLLALSVAAIGLYSLLAFEVARRRAELGIRAALGAPPRRLVLGVVGRALGVVGVGLGLGIAVAWVLAPGADALFFETSPRDAVTLAGVVLTLLLVALIAAGRPALRAGQADPTVAMREE